MTDTDRLSEIRQRLAALDDLQLRWAFWIQDAEDEMRFLVDRLDQTQRLLAGNRGHQELLVARNEELEARLDQTQDRQSQNLDQIVRLQRTLAETRDQLAQCQTDLDQALAVLDLGTERRSVQADQVQELEDRLAEANQHIQNLTRAEQGDLVGDAYYCAYCEGPEIQGRYAGDWFFQHDQDCAWNQAHQYTQNQKEDQ